MRSAGLSPPPDIEEWMDDPSLPLDDLRATMADQAMLHRLFGGHGAAAVTIRRFLRHRRGPLRIAELACGASDLLQAALASVPSSTEGPYAVGIDRSSRVLTVTRERGVDVLYVAGDLLALPVPDRSFDLVLLPHALHHLNHDQAVAAVREAARATRGLLLVLDLLPSRSARLLFRIAGLALRLHWASRYDGLVSFRRAYSERALHNIAVEAGLTGYRIRRHLFWRATIVWRPDTPTA